ncbi:MAG: hypothetical protein HY376_00875 [Candidatus Blackburnbacteria bacterium]|nr:hypothetical protein [Candidatus Blackburnbacteria bacterium]
MNLTLFANDSPRMGEQHPTVTEMFCWLMCFFAQGEKEADKLYPDVKRHFVCFRSGCRNRARMALDCTETHKDHPSVAENYEQRRRALLSRYWL